VPRLARAAALAGLVTLLAGCGGGDPPQDENEPSGDFPVEIESATFPRAQALGETSTLKVTVRNPGDKAIPNLALTVDGFANKIANPQAQDPRRPVWVVNEGPYNADTAYVDTWAVKDVPAGARRTFAWQVTAVQPGTHTVRYKVGAGLDGKAKAVPYQGGRTDGAISVRITRRPRDTVVDPKTGDVEERSAASQSSQ
jgi:hypothetical protein